MQIHAAEGCALTDTGELVVGELQIIDGLELAIADVAHDLTRRFEGVLDLGCGPGGGADFYPVCLLGQDEVGQFHVAGDAMILGGVSVQRKRKILPDVPSQMLI